MESDRYSLYRATQINKKVYNNIMNLIKNTKMNTIVTNSNNGKMSDPHRLLLNLTDKIDLRRKDKYVALSNISIYYTWENIKKSYKNNKFKISAPTWNEEFNYLMDHILHQIFKINLKIYLKSTEQRQLVIQEEYTQMKQKIESPLKLKQNIFLNF